MASQFLNRMPFKISRFISILSSQLPILIVSVKNSFDFRFPSGLPCRCCRCRQESRSGLILVLVYDPILISLSKSIPPRFSVLNTNLGFSLILISGSFLVVDPGEILPDQTCRTQRRGTLYYEGQISLPFFFWILLSFCLGIQVDLVTETDKACEDLVFSHLKEHFPSHKVKF